MDMVPGLTQVTFHCVRQTENELRDSLLLPGPL
jgi:hypothetical protein